MPLTSEQLTRARHLNRLYSRTLRGAGTAGWGDRFTQIAMVLGHNQPSSPGEDQFAQLVANWQASHNIQPVDGVIGERTWTKLEPKTRFSPNTNFAAPQWLATPVETRPTTESSLVRSNVTIPGRGWMFVVVEQLPEVGSRHVIRKVAVVPKDFVLKPTNPNGTLRPAEHALGQSPKSSQFLSASNRPYGSPTGGKGSTPLLIDTQRVKNAGGRIVDSAELITDLKNFATTNPNASTRVERLISTINDFEGETLIEGSTPAKSARTLSKPHLKYVTKAEEIFENVQTQKITRPQGAQQLQSLDDSFRAARNVGRVGRVIGGVGLVMTAYDVGKATNQSIEQKSFKPITAEGIRQVGGWAGGLAGAKIGFVAGAAVGIETGPGAIVTGAIGAIVVGFAGYTGADWVADLIHKNDE